MQTVSAPATILIVEDERSNLSSLERIFTREGYRTLLAEEGQAAMELCRKHRVHVVLTDLMMPGMSGIDLLKALKTIAPDAEAVVMTAYGTVETAVEAMREGAYDFVEKPLKRMQIVKTVRKAAERHALLAENRSLRKELSALRNRTIVGSSAALRQVFEVATQAAPSTATVLVLGESGTGKELLARYIHEHSGREGPFVAVNWRRCRRRSSKPSCSVTRKAPSRARSRAARAASGRPNAERYFSTRSASCRRRCRSSCCASCRKASTSRSAVARTARTFV